MAEIRIDEFGFILLAGLILIFILMIFWTTPPEALPIIEPSSINLQIFAGRSETFYLYIKGRSTNVTLKAIGRIANWVTFDKNYFNIIDEAKVKVIVSVPEHVDEGIYLGNIRFSSLGGEILIPVEVQVKKEVVKEISAKTISLGSFSIEKVISVEKVAEKESFEVFRSYFSKQDAALLINLPKEKIEKVVEATIKILVEETNELGNLIVFFNGEEVFNKKVGVGEVEIIIGKEKIKESNSVLIVAGFPGLHFWATTVYKIKKVEFFVKYKGIPKKEFYFSLDPYQAKNFLKMQISFLRIGEEVTPELIIKVNDQVIYYDVPPKIYFNKTFIKDIFGTPILLSENNKISFELKKEGKFEVEGAVLIIYYVT